MSAHRDDSIERSVSATSLSGTSGIYGSMTERRALNIEAGKLEHARYDAEVRQYMRSDASANRKYHVFMASITALSVLILAIVFAYTML